MSITGLYDSQKWVVRSDSLWVPVALPSRGTDCSALSDQLYAPPANGSITWNSQCSLYLDLQSYEVTLAWVSSHRGSWLAAVCGVVVEKITWKREHFLTFLLQVEHLYFKNISTSSIQAQNVDTWHNTKVSITIERIHCKSTNSQEWGSLLGSHWACPVCARWQSPHLLSPPRAYSVASPTSMMDGSHCQPCLLSTSKPHPLEQPYGATQVNTK